MFEVGDTVMYGNSGVCKITDIRVENFGRGEETYYVLAPVQDIHSIIYCPVDTDKIRIRKLMSVEEIQTLIRNMPDAEMAWIENAPERKGRYTEILRRADHEELIQLIKVLHLKRKERIQAGKKFYAADQRIMDEAEQILYGEFAQVLHIRPDEVVPYIMSRLEGKDAPAVNE